MNIGEELFFQYLMEESNGDKILNTNLWPEIVGTYPFLGSDNLRANLLEIHPLHVDRTQPTSFWLEFTHVLFRKVALNVPVLYMIA